VRATTSKTKNGALARLTLGSGILATGFFLLSVLIQWVLALIATGGELGLVGTLRDLSFLAGGPVHVPLFGLLLTAIFGLQVTRRALNGGKSGSCLSANAASPIL
jgi:hypothetical protein